MDLARREGVRWCEVAAARRPGYTIYAVILGSPTRGQRNSDLDRLLAWGVSRYRTLTLVGSGPVVRVSLPYGRAPVALVATRPLVRAVRTGRPVVERVIAPSAVGLPGREGEIFRRVVGWSLALVAFMCVIVALQDTPVLGWMVPS